MYLLGIDSLRIVQLGIALADSGFAGGTPNVLIVFSRIRALERALRAFV